MNQSSTPTVAEFYEPWHPQHGEHVRVRLSGECPFQRQRPETSFEAFHLPETDGRTGVVKPCPYTRPCTYRESGHGFVVKFDEAIKVRFGEEPYQIEAEHYAAIELEPVA